MTVEQVSGKWISGIPSREQVPDGVPAFFTVHNETGDRKVYVANGASIRATSATIIGFMQILVSGTNEMTNRLLYRPDEQPARRK